MIVQPLFAAVLLLSAWIPREQGLYRSQLHRGGGGVRPDNALWDLGFNVFTSDYPDAMFEAIGRLGH